MPGMLDLCERRLRRHLRRHAHRARIDQAVATAGQPQARHAQRRQLRAQVDGLEQAQAIGEHVRGRLAAREQVAAQRAQRLACVVGTEGLERDEAIERAAIVVAQAFAEVAEDLGGHAVFPVVAFTAHEARRRAVQDQAAHRLGSLQRSLQCEQAAERPAHPDRRRQAFEQGVGHRGQRQRRLVVAAMAVPGQVDQMQREVRLEQGPQRREHPAVHRPTMDQHQRRTVAARFYVHASTYMLLHTWIRARPQAAAPLRRSARSRATASASTRPSTSACVCSADSVMRKRARPSGTVGGRIAVTQ